MKLQSWLCVLACFPVTVSEQPQALITNDSCVITSNRAAGQFVGSTGVGSSVENACDLAFSG